MKLTPALWRYLPAVGMVIFITFVSLLPAACFKRVEMSVPPWPHMDKWIHAVMYGALSLSFHHALTVQNRVRVASVLWLTLLAGGYGLILEYGQGTLTQSRSQDLCDAIANLMGASLALWASFGWHRYRERPRR